MADILFELEQLHLRTHSLALCSAACVVYLSVTLCVTGKDKLEDEANAAAKREVPADVKARQVLWITEGDKAETAALCATLAKEKPGA